MTTKEFMESRGYYLSSDALYEKKGDPTAWLHIRHAKLLHATYIEGQIDALRRVQQYKNRGETPLNWPYSEIADLEITLSQIRKDGV